MPHITYINYSLYAKLEKKFRSFLENSYTKLCPKILSEPIYNPYVLLLSSYSTKQIKAFYYGTRADFHQEAHCGRFYKCGRPWLRSCSDGLIGGSKSQHWHVHQLREFFQSYVAYFQTKMSNKNILNMLSNECVII